MEEKAGLVATIINLRDIQRPAQRKSNQFAVERRLRLRRSIQGIWPGIESRVCIGIKEVSANAIGTGPAKSPEKEDPVPTPTERRSCRPARASRPPGPSANLKNRPPRPLCIGGAAAFTTLPASRKELLAPAALVRSPATPLTS